MYRPIRAYFRRRGIWRLLLVCLFTALTIFLLVAAIQLRPVLSSLAVARVQNKVNAATAEAVQQAVIQGEVSYDKLITLVKDHNGKVAALQSNMSEFTRLQTAIMKDVLQRLSQVSTSDLSISLGTLTGSPLLAGRGPAIKVRLQSVGSSNAYFENCFSEAGINQTKHQIILHTEVYVSILLPGYVTSTKVSGNYEVAETIIVGEVPGNYTYFHSDRIEETAEDYVLNKSG